MRPPTGARLVLSVAFFFGNKVLAQEAGTSPPSPPSTQEIPKDPRVEKCISFLRPQRVVDRDEFMDYMLTESTMDIIQKQDVTWDASSLRSRMINDEGNFFRNYTRSLPEYSVLPSTLRHIFVDEACSFRVDLDRVGRYCRRTPWNLTDIPRLSGISFGDMSNGAKKDMVANMTCTESYSLWPEVVENVLGFYAQNNLVSNYDPPVVIAQEDETPVTTVAPQEDPEDPVGKCISFLRPQRAVDRGEFMDYMLTEATVDIIQKQEVSWDASSLRARMINEDGNFFRNYTRALPDYTVLPSYLLNTFVEQACSFRVDVDRVRRYCQRFPRNLTDIPRLSGISFAGMSNGAKKDTVANMTCTESFSLWPEVVENVLGFYAQNNLVSNYDPPVVIAEAENPGTTAPPQEEPEDPVGKCTSFLRPQRVVDRDEFMDYMLKESTMDVIKKQSATWDVSSLKARMINDEGKFFRNYTRSLPEYSVLPSYLRYIFVDKACSFRVDVDRVGRYCRRTPWNLTDIPRLSGISFGDMSNGAKKDTVANLTCTEAFGLWPQVVESMLGYYVQNNLVSAYPTSSPTPSPTLSPTKNPTLAPTENPTKNPTKSPTKTPTLNPTVSPTPAPTEAEAIFNVSVPPFLMSLGGIEEQEVDKVELLEKAKVVLGDEFAARAGPDQEFLGVELKILTEAEERNARVLQSQSSKPILFAGTAHYHGSAPDVALVKTAVHEALRGDKFIKSLQSSNNEAISNVKTVEVTFKGDEVAPLEKPPEKKNVGGTVKIVIGVIALVIVAALLVIYYRMRSSCKGPKGAAPAITDVPKITEKASEDKSSKEEKEAAKKWMDSDFGEEVPL